MPHLVVDGCRVIPCSNLYTRKLRCSPRELLALLRRLHGAVQQGKAARCTLRGSLLLHTIWLCDCWCCGLPCNQAQSYVCAHLPHSALQSLARQAVAEYVKVADKHGLTPSELALAWCDSRWFVASTIIGATSLDQLKVP